jgi:hypothetical protein
MRRLERSIRRRGDARAALDRVVLSVPAIVQIVIVLLRPSSSTCWRTSACRPMKPEPDAPASAAAWPASGTAYQLSLKRCSS